MDMLRVGSRSFVEESHIKHKPIWSVSGLGETTSFSCRDNFVASSSISGRTLSRQNSGSWLSTPA
jgi:hypothetical protein